MSVRHPALTLANASSVTDGFRCWRYPSPEQTNAMLLAESRSRPMFPWISPLVQCGKTALVAEQIRQHGFNPEDFKPPRFTNPINNINTRK
jgi:hypothetical protein